GAHLAWRREGDEEAWQGDVRSLQGAVREVLGRSRKGAVPHPLFHLRASRLRREGHGGALRLPRGERLAPAASAGLHADADDAGDGHVLLGVPSQHGQAAAYPEGRGRKGDAARAVRPAAFFRVPPAFFAPPFRLAALFRRGLGSAGSSASRRSPPCPSMGPGIGSPGATVSSSCSPAPGVVNCGSPLSAPPLPPFLRSSCIARPPCPRTFPRRAIIHRGRNGFNPASRRLDARRLAGAGCRATVRARSGEKHARLHGSWPASRGCAGFPTYARRTSWTIHSF